MESVLNPKIVRRIEKIKVAEERARNARNRLDAAEDAWQKVYDAIPKDGPEWLAYCAETGISRHYNFGDVLA